MGKKVVWKKVGEKIKIVEKKNHQKKLKKIVRKKMVREKVGKKLK